MTLSTYLLYLAAVALLVLSPGPTMLMCITTALNSGPRRAMTGVAGSVSAVLCIMLLSLYALGVSRIAPLLHASRPLRWVNRICGGLFTLMGGVLLLTRRHT
jgi:threonine/homoserine/homoserine lactone efflux protein